MQQGHTFCECTERTPVSVVFNMVFKFNVITAEVDLFKFRRRLIRPSKTLSVLRYLELS